MANGWGINRLPSHEYVASIIDYCPESGSFVNKIDRGNRSKKGREVGYKSKHTGYVSIFIDGRHYYAHRLAWLIHHGLDPGELVVDHVNGDPSDNRISNLRIASQSQNLGNSGKRAGNTSGHKGVVKSGKKWCYQFSIEGKHVTSRRFETKESAASAYADAFLRARGEYARVE